MGTQHQVILRSAIAFVAAALLSTPVGATSWGPREDMGVAAVDTRTGKVLWEAWRLDEVPAGASNEEKAAVEYLLAMTRDHRGPVPRVAPFPDVPTKGLVIKNPWPDGLEGGGSASEGKSLIYYRHPKGVIALDRETKKETWRLLTTRYPYASSVLEVGENRAFIQIGSDIPATIHTALVGGGDGRLRMRNLEPHTLKQRAAAAALLHHYGDGYLRPEVRKLLEQLRAEKNDPAAAIAAKAIEQLLAKWPQKRDRQRLLEGCVSVLLKTDEGNPLRDFAWPEAPRVLAWCLLQELIYGIPVDGYSRQGYNYAYHHGWDEQPTSLTDATKATLADHCRKVVGEGPEAEKPFAASVLVSTAVGWGKLTAAERKKLFLSSNPSAWRWAALALAKNGQRKELMEWTRERPGDDHLDVIWVLKHNKPKEWAEPELTFWLACARRNAGGVAYVLRLCDGPAPKDFRGPICTYLEREIAKPTIKNDATQELGYLFAAVYLLDSWNNADDTPLLVKYLKHPVENLRGHVRSLLEQRGVKLPPDNGIEKNTGPGKK